MAEQRYTPEIINKALEPEERLQYRHTGRYYQSKRIDELWAMTTSTVKFHEATRHSFVTRLLEQGIPAKWVSLLASHKDLQSIKPYDHIKIKNIQAKVYEIQSSHAQKGHARVMHDKNDKKG